MLSRTENRSLGYAAANAHGLCSCQCVWAMQLPVCMGYAAVRLRDLSALMQILVQPADTYSIHIDVKTTDKNTTRVSISNLFNPEALKVHFVLRM